MLQLVALDDLLALYEYFGYAGVFFMSFVIGILFFLLIPYFPVPIIASLNENLNPHLIYYLVILEQYYRK
jgi:hypothetical protein